MSLFIRIDNVGGWKGINHKSYLGVIGEESFEGGISCYELEKGCIEELYSYWKNDAWNTESEGRQITIFEGKKIGMGSSFEDLATCEKTIMELPATILFDNIKFFENIECGFEYYEDEEEHEISFDDDIFEGMNKFEIIEKIILKLIK